MALYFIREDGTEFVKIGIARCATVRLAGIQVHNPRRLYIAREIEGDVFEEKAAHSKFDHLRVRGEWFTFSEEMMTWHPGTKPLPKPEPAAYYKLPKDAPLTPMELACNAFGGRQQLADALGFTPGLISAWKSAAYKTSGYHRGAIPIKHHNKIREEAAKRGISLPPGVFSPL